MFPGLHRDRVQRLPPRSASWPHRCGRLHLRSRTGPLSLALWTCQSRRSSYPSHPIPSIYIHIICVCVHLYDYMMHLSQPDVTGPLSASNRPRCAWSVLGWDAPSCFLMVSNLNRQRMASRRIPNPGGCISPELPPPWIIVCEKSGLQTLAVCTKPKMWKLGERVYSVLNHFEPTRTSLDLSWDNACACEQQLGNNFKFVGTDLWTIEPIGTIILLDVFRVWGQRSSGGKSWAMLIYESWRPCITRSRAAQSWCSSWTISQVTFSSQNSRENTVILLIFQ